MSMSYLRLFRSSTAGALRRSSVSDRSGPPCRPAWDDTQRFLARIAAGTEKGDKLPAPRHRRLIQTSLREWAYARAYNTSDERTAELPQQLGPIGLRTCALQRTGAFFG